MMLSMEAGVLKTMMDTPITTTRFTQLPTECVTGLSRDSSAYDASTSAVRHTPCFTPTVSAHGDTHTAHRPRCSARS